MSGTSRCPSCRHSVPAGAFQCPRCELLLVELSEDLELQPGEGSVVEALFEKPRASSARKRSTQSAAREQTDSVPLPSEGARPRVLAGLQLSRMYLSRLEAAVVGATDGMLTVREIARALRIPVPELQRVLQGLIGIGVVAISEPPVFPDTDEMVAGDEDDDAVPTVKFDLGELLERAQRNAPPRPREARPPPPPPPRQPRAPTPAPRAPTPVPRGSTPAPRPRTRTGAGGGLNPLEQAIKLERSGRGLEALRYLELAISRSEDAAPLYNRLAIVLIRERFDFRSAERMLLKALELAPSHPVYKANLLAVRQRKPISTHPVPALKDRR